MELGLYRCKDGTSAAQLAASLAVYAGLWLAAFPLSDRLGLGVLLLALPIGLLNIRLFNILHDCTHGSYFSQRRWNAVAGVVLGFFTLTPFHYWRKHHLAHHATNANLDRRGYGDVLLLTLEEFAAASPMRRFHYRAYRHPLVYLLVGPIVYFFVKMRWPGIASSRREFAGVLLVDAAIAGAYALALLFTVHPWALIALHMSAGLTGGAIGVWLFFVQHQFDGVYWARSGEWNAKAAAMQGSSFLVLPRALEWLFARINLHHVHHLDPLIPNYLLRTSMEAERLTSSRTVAPLEGLAAFRLKLWDEDNGRLVGFPARGQ